MINFSNQIASAILMPFALSTEMRETENFNGAGGGGKPTCRLMIEICRETAEKMKKLPAQKKFKKIVDGLLTYDRFIAVMPNKHSPDKICLSTWIPRTLHARIGKIAGQKGMNQTEYVEHLYTQATRHIELTPDDYRRIARDTEAARKKAAAK